MTSKSPNPRLFVAALAAAAAIAVILVVATTRSSAAPIFTVIDPTDAPDAQLNGVCASTNQGLCTLRAAVQEAEHAGGGHIVLSAGIGDYRLTTGRPGGHPAVPPTAPATSTSAPTSPSTAIGPGRLGHRRRQHQPHLRRARRRHAVADERDARERQGGLRRGDVPRTRRRDPQPRLPHPRPRGGDHQQQHGFQSRMGRRRDHQRRRGAAVECDRRQEQHRRAGRRHREQGDTPVAERDGHRELRASRQGRRNLLRHGPERPDVHGGHHRGFEPSGRGLLWRAEDHLLRGQPRERQHLPLSRLLGPPQGQARVRSQRLRPAAVLPAAPQEPGRRHKPALSVQRHPQRASPAGRQRRRHRALRQRLLRARAGGQAALFIRSVRIREGQDGAKRIRVVVWLSARSTHTVTVRATTRNGSARAGSDFVAKSVKLTFRPGQRHKRFTVAVNGDRTRERNEKFRVRLSAPKGAPIADAGATVTIVSDDPRPSG